MEGVVILVIIASVIVGMLIRYDNLVIEGEWIKYVIKKNKHYSIKKGIPFLSLPIKIKRQKGSLRFSAIFSEGCAYDSNVVGDDINKLYGVSYGFDHQYRSVRIGWRYNSNLGVIELFVYAYVRGKRYYKHLFNCALHELVTFCIFRAANNQVIVEGRVSGSKPVIETVNDIDESVLDFVLWPYFGGNKAAPHEMNILIKLK